MSELAFNANGESFEVPASVTGWRVRRMKPRGAPELVYGGDGRPLMIPVDCEMDDLREAVGGVLGRYRLDPVNDEGKVVDSVSAAYIQVVKPERNAGDVVTSSSLREPADDSIREAMRLNTELAKAVIDRFPQMVEAAATLLRAADGAGLPARAPIATDDEVEDIDEAPASSGFDLNALVAQIVPMIVMGFTSGKLKVPSLASVVDWRKAKATKQVTAAASQEAEQDEAPEAAPAAAGLPPIEPAMMAHFIAIQSALTPNEAALARQVAGELEPVQLRAWFDELSALSVPDAVEKIRALIGGKGGAS